MPALFLDIQQHVQVTNFVHAQLPFLPNEEQEGVEERVEAAEKHSQALIELARELAKKTWPARRALQLFAEEQEGCEQEWRLVVASVSKSTAHLLERFRHGTACVSLDETLAHEESDSALRDQERREIDAVRQHVREALWRDLQQSTLAPLVARAVEEFAEIARRVETLRNLAAETPWIEGEVFTKVAQVEDAFLFAGKRVSLEQLDEEIAYYREQKELPM